MAEDREHGRGAALRDGQEARVLRPADEEFPAPVRAADHMPALLHVRGTLVRADALAVAVVGARAATPYGLDVAERLAADLAARGVTIVSGLARGIDAAAHRGALRARGRTIAVLGCGVDVAYPPEHRALMATIAEHGAVISEFPRGTRPLAQNFPRRNRIIAGLALAVVVVEAAEKSGALGTARWAADLGREVMAVPGRVTGPESRGCHQLLRDGAALVESWEDVVRELPAHWRAAVGGARAAGPTATLSDEAAQVLDAVGEAASIDEIIERSGVASGRAAALLLTLELEGRVRQLPGKRFARAGGA